MIEAYVNKRPYEHHTSLDCQHHQASLGERRQLKLTDVFSDRWGLPFPYFSTLVKWAHCVKSRYPLIKQTCETLFSPALALRVCGKVVRIPVATRWGSTGDCEEDLSRAEPKEYIVIMEAATLPAKGSKKRSSHWWTMRPTGDRTAGSLDCQTRQVGGGTHEGDPPPQVLGAQGDQFLDPGSLAPSSAFFLHKRLSPGESHFFLLVTGDGQRLLSEFSDCLTSDCTSFQKILELAGEAMMHDQDCSE